MKYIRTEDGKIIDTSLFENYKKNGGHWNYVDWFNFITKNSPVIRNGSTIEELCDEFYLVVYDALANKKVRISFENCNSAKTHCDRYFKNFDWSIYGAIWTDKGLIYVAKMNDKGELELL